MNQETNLTMCPEDCEVYPEEFPLSYKITNVVIMLILMPCVSILGIIGNTINASIYLRLQGDKDESPYLAAVAISDLVMNAMGIAVMVLHSATSYSLFLTRFTAWFIRYALPITYAAQTCSVYFTVLAALQLYLSTCWKDRALTLACRGKQQIGIVIVTAFSVFYNVPRVGELSTMVCWSLHHKALIVMLCPTVLLRQLDEFSVVYNVFIQSVIMSLLPCALLGVLSVSVIRTVRRNHRSIHRRLDLQTSLPPVSLYSLTRSGSTQRRNAVQYYLPHTRSNGTQMALIVVILMFLFCSVPGLIVCIFEQLQLNQPNPAQPNSTEHNATQSNIHPPEVNSSFIVHYLVDVHSLMVVIGASVNFCIYIYYDKDFRVELSKMRFFAKLNRRRKFFSVEAALRDSFSTMRRSSTLYQSSRASLRSVVAKKESRTGRRSAGEMTRGVSDVHERVVVKKQMCYRTFSQSVVDKNLNSKPSSSAESRTSQKRTQVNFNFDTNENCVVLVNHAGLDCL